MKPLLIAAALAVLPAAAHAQVAAGSVPDPFARDGQGEATAPAVREPLNAAAEATLRTIIASAQAGAMDYSVMTEDLASKVREQEAQVTPLIQGFGALQSIEFVGSENGADLFAVTFAEAATQWIIGFNEDGKVAALLFRPAQ